MAADTNGIYPLETPSYPGLDINANQTPRIIGVSAVLIALTAVAVALRFLARWRSKVGFWWDDWIILAAMLMSWGACLLMMILTNIGFGRHIQALGDLDQRINIAETWFKGFYAYETVYTFAVALCKYSILLFYSRIFPERPFRIALYIVVGFVTAWFIAIEITVLAECLPASSLWNFAESGTCINFESFFVGAGIPNILLNAVILVMPLPMIWTLEISRKYRLALCSIFLLGGFVVVVSIIRTVILSQLQQVDITWEFVDAGIWTSVEPSIAVVSACLPILRSLWITRNRKCSTDQESNDMQDIEIPAIKSPRRGPEKKSRSGSTNSSHPLNELSAGEYPWTKDAPPAPYKESQGSSSEEEAIPLEKKLDSKHKKLSNFIRTAPPLAELYG